MLVLRSKDLSFKIFDKATLDSKDSCISEAISGFTQVINAGVHVTPQHDSWQYSDAIIDYFHEQCSLFHAMNRRSYKLVDTAM